ncbi:MAG: tyrosine-type recombinase/integrase [Promethearchaeota archaeon]
MLHGGRPISYRLTIPALVTFSQKIEKRTTSTYTSCARNFQRYMDERDLTLETLTPLLVKDFIQQMGKWKPNKGYAEMNTAALYKKFILAFFGSVGRRDDIKWIKANLKEVKFVSKFKVDIPTEEILRLIDVTLNDKRKNASYKPHLAFGWSIMAFDGFRPSEALGLYYTDIDWETSQVSLVRHPKEKYFPKTMKVGDPAISIPLNELSMSLLNFTTKFDRQERIIPVSYTTLRRRFIRYAKMAEVKDREGNKLTPHKLRHVFGHLWRRNKGDLQVLKEVMRHSDIRITMIYSAPSSGEIEDEFEKTINLQIKEVGYCGNR